MARKRTGLRNRYRSGGKSTYAVERKAKFADRYGAFQQGKCIRPDTIDGRTFNPIRIVEAYVMGNHNAPGESQQKRDYTPAHDKEHGLIGAKDVVDSAMIDRAIRNGAVRITPRPQN